MSFSVEQIKRLANLAKLEFSDEEAAEFAKEFEPIKAFADQIINADVEMGVSAKVVNMDDIREDEAKVSMPNEKVLLNAPEQRNHCFAVKRIVEGGRK